MLLFFSWRLLGKQWNLVLQEVLLEQYQLLALRGDIQGVYMVTCCLFLLGVHFLRFYMNKYCTGMWCVWFLVFTLIIKLAISWISKHFNISSILLDIFFVLKSNIFFKQRFKFVDELKTHNTWTHQHILLLYYVMFSGKKCYAWKC